MGRSVLTKPAGVFLQLLGVGVLVAGVAELFPDPVTGVALLVLGAWLIYQGGKPARNRP